ncbi:hypothetical protein A9K55_007950 [Cordyceps militaris]|uniref:Uncharacterized protein n=1 Tax=Cordyceps militaris TaxID=73501 RepID=A0A2H4SJC4_CORMI|nr:hypothetical protein A9K55_007950 [Cordyceps militaris]
MTISATLKFDSEDMHTHTAPTLDLKATPKSEPEDDVDSPPLLNIPYVQEDTTPAPVFVRYGSASAATTPSRWAEWTKYAPYAADGTLKEARRYKRVSAKY